MNTGIFVGNLTRDIVVRTTQTGRKVGTFSIACNRPYVDKNTGETKTGTDYINVVLWGNYDFSGLIKGVPVIVIGRQTTRSYETAEGEKKYITEIIASSVGMLMRPIKTGQVSQGNFDQFAAGGNDGFCKPAYVQEDIPF